MVKLLSFLENRDFCEMTIYELKKLFDENNDEYLGGCPNCTLPVGKSNVTYHMKRKCCIRYGELNES